MFSMGIVVPRTFLWYLLTADWVTPRISATWVSFMSCFSKSFLAKSARMAGETVFTATSQGANNFTPDVLLLWENLYKYVVCHVLV